MFPPPDFEKEVVDSNGVTSLETDWSLIRKYFIECRWKTAEKCKKVCGAISWKRYDESRYLDSKCYLKMWTVQFAKGLLLLCRMRLHAYYICPNLAAMRYIPEKYKLECLFCNALVKESYEHILLYCPRWAKVRELLLSRRIAFLREKLHLEIGVVLDDVAMTTALLGGKCARFGQEGNERVLRLFLTGIEPAVGPFGLVRYNDVIEPEIFKLPLLDPALGFISLSEDLNCRESTAIQNGAGYLLVARFLQSIARVREVAIGKFMNRPLGS